MTAPAVIGDEPASGSPGIKTRVAGQGALLLAGLGASQLLSFARNALLGHMLSKGDFGIAATLTLMLQMIDALSDLGADRLIVQAPDGDAPRLQAVAHALLVARGFLTALALVAVAPLIVRFFRLDGTLWAFQSIALVPAIKGFLHLDARRAQRRLDNRGLMLIEVLPQAIVLMAAVPMLATAPRYPVVIWLSLLQAAMMVLASHAQAERPYRLALDRSLVVRFLVFGWPILASALPLAAIFQGDRIVIGRLLGMETLATYSTAFMVTMVPGLIAAKVANALMLPLFSECRRDDVPMLPIYARMCDVTAITAALYLSAFVIAGGAMLPVAFGPHYAGHGDIVGWLALMWALRMLQAVPGMALMAASHTRPLLWAGLIRAFALLPAFIAARHGAGLTGIAAMGCLGEAASLLYVAWRTTRLERGLASTLLGRTALIAPAAIAALGIVLTLPASVGLVAAVSAAASLCTVIGVVGIALSPTLRGLLRSRRYAIAAST